MLKVLNKCREVNLKLNKIKYKQNNVKYIGHIVSDVGLKVDQDKVSLILNMPPPNNKADLLRFNGFVTYVSKFIPNLSEINYPLRQLLKKEAIWHWGDEQNKSFVKINEIISSVNSLKYFDINKMSTVSVDASSFALGACLLQDGRPIAFASRSLNDHEKLYSQIEKECLAILFDCKKFRQYIYGKHSIIESDHKPFKSIFNKNILKAPPRLQKLLIKLTEFDIEGIHRPEKELIIANFLSRNSSYDKLVTEIRK